MVQRFRGGIDRPPTMLGTGLMGLEKRTEDKWKSASKVTSSTGFREAGKEGEVGSGVLYE